MAQEATEVNDGGQAFPRSFSDMSGMTLRDWFAGQAMAGLIRAKDALHVLNGEPEYPLERNLSDASYLIADAMLAAREVTS